MNLSKASIKGVMWTTAVIALSGCGGGSEPSDAPEVPVAQVSRETIMNGRNTFLRTCATCHGADAKGLANNGLNLTDSEFVRTQTDDQLLQYVIEGREVPGGVPMPPRGGFKEADLSDNQIRDVIAYIRQFPGNKP